MKYYIKQKSVRFYIHLFIAFIAIGSFAYANDPKPKAVSDPNAVWPTPEQILNTTQNRLVTNFNQYLKSPEDYKKRVKLNCEIFPEGDLFSYIYPAMAYINVALKDSQQRNNSVRQAQKLIDLATISVTKRVRPPGGRLENLKSYQNHATYLGQLNLALGAYYLISKDNRYDRLHQVLSDVFHEAMIESQGRALNSFPEYSWPFDTVPVLVSLHLYDKKTSSHRSEKIIKQHLTWVSSKASHPQYNLPYSRINNLTGWGKEFPRGCDLSFRICLLSHIDRMYTKQLYEDYTRTFWLDKGMFAGFSEWPNGISRFEDVDSGPIVMGIGLGATGMGLGAAIAVEDNQRLERLSSQMQTSSVFIRPLLVKNQQFSDQNKAPNLGIPISNEFFSGFLFGDAMLFYCVTWQQW